MKHTSQNDSLHAVNLKGEFKDLGSCYEKPRAFPADELRVSGAKSVVIPSQTVTPVEWRTSSIFPFPCFWSLQSWSKNLFSLFPAILTEEKNTTETGLASFTLFASCFKCILRRVNKAMKKALKSQTPGSLWQHQHSLHSHLTQKIVSHRRHSSRSGRRFCVILLSYSVKYWLLHKICQAGTLAHARSASKLNTHYTFV